MTAFSDPVALASALIACPSVTPAEAGALDLVEGWLRALGFSCERMRFGEVDNLWAERGEGGKRLCFAGHTDVVPAGDLSRWGTDPFSPHIEDGVLRGRGAADMKGAIGAMIAAIARSENAPPLAFLITGDEEGPAHDGTQRVLAAIEEQGRRFDHCVVGEPTNPHEFGTMMKVGRRGSMNAVLTVAGEQGHVAYPALAKNPVPALMAAIAALAVPLDGGYARFQPSNFEVTALGASDGAENVIPEKAWARFNVRFNPNWTGESLEAELRRRLDRIATDCVFALAVRVSGEAFLTEDDQFCRLIADAVEAETGLRPEASTSGGTSDARFLSRHAPTVEFGLVGETMHKIDERVAVADIEGLTAVYADILSRYAKEAPAW